MQISRWILPVAGELVWSGGVRNEYSYSGRNGHRIWLLLYQSHPPCQRDLWILLDCWSKKVKKQSPLLPFVLDDLDVHGCGEIVKLFSPFLPPGSNRGWFGMCIKLRNCWKVQIGCHWKVYWFLVARYHVEARAVSILVYCSNQLPRGARGVLHHNIGRSWTLQKCWRAEVCFPLIIHA